MINRCLRLGLAWAACTAAIASGQVSFRVVAQLPEFVPTGLTEGSPGVFYLAGGFEYGGSGAFSVTSAGEVTNLTSLPSDYNIGSLTVTGADFRTYSVTEYSGYPANVFSVTSQPGSAVFYPGQSLTPLLMQNLPDRKFLAITAYPWSVADVALDGTVSSIYLFPSTDRPNNVIYGANGNYYGVAQGSSSDYAFQVTPLGVASTLFNFPAGYFVVTPLLQATDGNLYGALTPFSLTGAAFIYKLTLNGDYSLLYTFPKGASGAAALIEASDGNLYGCTYGFYNAGYGELFSITKSGAFRAIGPYVGGGCGLTQGSDGIIYGSALYQVFALDLGLPAPAPRMQHFTPESGAPGTQVMLWGYNLLSPSVEFNGVPAAALSNSGPNYVYATVPPGATTGPITVSTPGGTTITQSDFTVQ
jgi:hypothetical protein